MGLFKSRPEKTNQALCDAASACAQEAKTKFKQIMFAYEKGRISNDPYISAFKELYKSMYGRVVGSASGYDENDPTALLLETHERLGGMFPWACVYYIYLNLMIALIKKENTKHLSRESLEELEKYYVVSERICELFPQRFIIAEKVDIYVFDTWKDRLCPNCLSVQKLFEDKFNLI